jgi:hypothetical protein
MSFRHTGGLASVAAALAAVAAPAASAHEWGFGPWSQPSELADVNSEVMDGCPFPSRDGRRLYIASTRDGGLGGIDIWVAERPHERAPWGQPVNMGKPINSEHNDFCPSPQGQGRFMFVSNRPGGCGGGDIYLTRFHPRLGWAPPHNLGCEINSDAEEAGPVRSGHELYFSSTRSGGGDIYRSLALGSWIGPPTPVTELNSQAGEFRPFVSADGKEIVFDAARPDALGSTDLDVWSARRPHRRAPWSEPANLGDTVNSPAAETRPSLSTDRSVLYLGSTRGTSQDVFASTRTRRHP